MAVGTLLTLPRLGHIPCALCPVLALPTALQLHMLGCGRASAELHGDDDDDDEEGQSTAVCAPPGQRHIHVSEAWNFPACRGLDSVISEVFSHKSDSVKYIDVITVLFNYFLLEGKLGWPR